MADDTDFDNPDIDNPDIDNPDIPNDTGLDLTPRAVDVAAGQRRKRILPMLVLAGVVVGLGFVLLQTLGSAALFFYNADEAVERRDELVEQRFRAQPHDHPVL